MPYKHVCYGCTCCGTVYNREIDALMCEERHLLDGEKDKYSRYDLIRIFNLIESRGSDPCDYCEHAYYVYGCEQECSFRNSGKCFSCGLDRGKKFDPKVEDIVKKFVTHKEERKKGNSDYGIAW